MVLWLDGCPGPWCSWRNLATPPASKDAESPSTLVLLVEIFAEIKAQPSLAGLALAEPGKRKTIDRIAATIMYTSHLPLVPKSCTVF